MSTHGAGPADPGGMGGPPPGGRDPSLPTQPMQPGAGAGAGYGAPEYAEPARFERGAPPQYGYDYQQQGPGMGERASQAMDSVARQWRTPETKEFFKTSEFLVWLLVTAGILIAGLATSGEDDVLRADDVWRYVALLSGAYILSRGLSKAATRRGEENRRF